MGENADWRRIRTPNNTVETHGHLVLCVSAARRLDHLWSPQLGSCPADIVRNALSRVARRVQQPSMGCGNRRLIFDTYPPLTPLECIGSELRPLDSGDRLRNVVILGVMLSAEALVGLALFATGFWSALPWRVLAGTGLAGCYMPCLKVFTDRLPQAQHARAVSSRTRRLRLFHWHRLIGRGRLSEKHAGDFLTLLRR